MMKSLVRAVAVALLFAAGSAGAQSSEEEFLAGLDYRDGVGLDDFLSQPVAHWIGA